MRAEASARGITAGTLRSLRAGAARAAPCSCLRGPRWIRPTTRSPSATPDGRTALGRAQHAGRAPVAGEPAGVRGQQHDVGRDRGRGEVLLVLDRVAASAPTEPTTSVGARSSFAAASGPAASFSARQRLRADDAEPPRVRQVVVRRPARELEQLVERLARHGLGAVDLVGPPACGSLPRHPPGRS